MDYEIKRNASYSWSYVYFKDGKSREYGQILKKV